MNTFRIDAASLSEKAPELRAGDRVTASGSGGRVVLTREEPGSLPA